MPAAWQKIEFPNLNPKCARTTCAQYTFRLFEHLKKIQFFLVFHQKCISNLQAAFKSNRQKYKRTWALTAISVYFCAAAHPQNVVFTIAKSISAISAYCYLPFYVSLVTKVRPPLLSFPTAIHFVGNTKQFPQYIPIIFSVLYNKSIILTIQSLHRFLAEPYYIPQNVKLFPKVLVHLFRSLKIPGVVVQMKRAKVLSGFFNVMPGPGCYYVMLWWQVLFTQPATILLHFRVFNTKPQYNTTTRHSFALDQ